MDDRQELGRTSNIRGHSAELHAGGFLLNHFSQVGQPRPDLAAVDYWARKELRGRSAHFCIQVKAATQFAVSAAKVGDWLNNLDHNPVILLRVGIVGSDRQRYRFLLLHDWVLEHPNWKDRVSGNGQIVFSDADFHYVGAKDRIFAAAVRQETERVLDEPGSLFRTARSPLIPFSEVEMISLLGRLSHVEATTAVLEMAARFAPTPDAAGVRTFLYWLWSNQSIATVGTARAAPLVEWLANLCEAPSVRQTVREREEFRNFVVAMRRNSRGQRVTAPRFVWTDVSCWRVFLSTYPEGFRLVEQFVRDGIMNHRAEKLKVGLHLASGLSHSGDPMLRHACCALIRRAGKAIDSDSARNLDEYLLVRQYRFARAESEGGGQVLRCQEYIHRHNADGAYESMLHVPYYGAGDRVTMNIMLKMIAKPKTRDAHTTPIRELIYDVIKRRNK